MVLKHPLNFHEENTVFSNEMLKEEWNKKIQFVKELIPGGHVNKETLELLQSIYNSSLSENLFVGSSMSMLLISKPNNGKLNYQKTLALSFENGQNKLSYSDWDTIEKEEEWQKAILWEKQCKGENLKKTFDEFLTWIKNWG